MTQPSRSSVFWWMYVAALAAAAVFLAYSFVGILVLGLFGYYATRPIRARFGAVIESKRIAAGLTAVTIILPILILTLYAGVRMVHQIQRRFEESVLSMLTSRIVGFDVQGNGLGSLLRNPPSLNQLTNLIFGSAVQQGLHVLDLLFGTILLLGLAVTLSYALLVYDETLSDAFVRLIGGTDETVYAYAKAVDADLESIFFGNLLFVLVMSVVAIVAYTATNFFAPAGAQIPMVFTLGVLTGLASLIPIVVGKVVYLPVVAYLAVATTQEGSGGLVFVGIVLVAYVLVLDILPQSFLQPYISGQQLNPMVLLFAYILGPTLFGWYGFFLLPIVFVMMLEVVRIVLPELLHGEPIKSAPGVAEETGADTEEMQEETDEPEDLQEEDDEQPPSETDETSTTEG